MLKSDKLPVFVWLWFPPLLLLAQLVFERVVPPSLLPGMMSENGPHETLQFLFIGAAFCVAFLALRFIDWKTQRWMGLWVLLAAACCFYVAGEEISWGQQLLHWTTPEFWNGINDQGETNLHNTTSWFDQKPRILLQLGVLVGGIIMPLLRRFKPSLLPQKFAVIYPPDILAVTALTALFVNTADRIGNWDHALQLFHRASEVEELYLYYFVLLYLVVLRRRILQDKR